MLDGRAYEPTTADGAMRRGGHCLRAVDAAARGCVFRAQRSQSLWGRPLPKTLLKGVRPLFESNARNRCALLAATFSVPRLRTQSWITSSSKPFHTPLTNPTPWFLSSQVKGQSRPYKDF